MRKKIILELTVEQALALRTMCGSSDQRHSDDDIDYTPVMRRALAKLEDAIEQVRGTRFAHRFSERKESTDAN